MFYFQAAQTILPDISLIFALIYYPMSPANSSKAKYHAFILKYRKQQKACFLFFNGYKL